MTVVFCIFLTLFLAWISEKQTEWRRRRSLEKSRLDLENNNDTSIKLDVDVPFGMHVFCDYWPEFNKYNVYLIDDHYERYYDYSHPTTIEEAIQAGRKLVEDAIKRRGYR